jgi:DNA polymerase-1
LFGISLYDHQGVIKKMGVRPDQILDLLALTGDSADNIPGVTSVGPKTAVKWLEQFDSIEGVKANAEQIKGKVGEKLRDNFDLLALSYHSPIALNLCRYWQSMFLYFVYLHRSLAWR